MFWLPFFVSSFCLSGIFVLRVFGPGAINTTVVVAGEEQERVAARGGGGLPARRPFRRELSSWDPHHPQGHQGATAVIIVVVAVCRPTIAESVRKHTRKYFFLDASFI